MRGCKKDFDPIHFSKFYDETFKIFGKDFLVGLKTFSAAPHIYALDNDKNSFITISN